MLVPNLEPLPESTLEHLRRATTASITTELAKHGISHCFMAGIVPLDPSHRLVGQAVTLRYVPRREDIDKYGGTADPNHPQRRAIDTIGPDEVLVVDARGEIGSGTLGDILCARIKAAGGAGVVTDGCVRDSGGIRDGGLPVFLKGTNAQASFTVHHAADWNTTIGCGGVMVQPGDVLVGDSDGVVVIPRHLAGDVAKAAAAREDLEAYIMKRVQAGESIRGLYPPNAENLAAYEAQRAGKG
jgi:regulator of RNase E activity RraA